MSKPTFNLSIRSEFEELDRVVDETESIMSTLLSDDDKVYNAVLLVSEAVTNAIEHGNKMDPDKEVEMNIWTTDEYVDITVQDQGEGFASGEVENPLDQSNLLEDHGRGIFLMKQLADALTIEDDGRRVRMRFAR